MGGVAKGLPVPNELPPDELLYQFKVAPEVTEVAAKVTGPVPHLPAGVVVDITGELTVITMTFEYPIPPPFAQVTFNL